MLKRFAALGAIFWLIFLGIVAIVELILTIGAKSAVSRSQNLTGLLVFVILGVVYYLLFRLLGGWNASTWDAPGSGRKTLLFLLGLPGLLVGAVVLIFIIWFWLTDDTSTQNYHLAKKKKAGDAAVSPVNEAAGSGENA